MKWVLLIKKKRKDRFPAFVCFISYHHEKGYGYFKTLPWTLRTLEGLLSLFLTCIVLSWGQLLISLHQFSHRTKLLDKLSTYFPKFWSFKYKIPSLHSSWQSNCEDDSCSFPNLDWLKLRIRLGQTSGMHFCTEQGCGSFPHIFCVDLQKDLLQGRSKKEKWGLNKFFKNYPGPRCRAVLIA